MSTRAELAEIARAVAPVVREGLGTLEARFLVLERRNLELEAKLAALEARPVVVGERGPAGERGLDGKDGRDGRDGKDGRDGTDGKDGAAGAAGVRGEPGKDGIDAFDLECKYDGERTISFVWTRLDGIEGHSTETRAYRVPVVLYRGVFEDGKAYESGDAVTWAGALWIARADTSARPGLPLEASRAWTLASKAGRDGKPGKDGKDGRDGINGKDYGRY